MLGRLIGEDIDLAIVPADDLGQVRVDPGQMEQVVVNLCVNARDSMPDGGRLRIRTDNVERDAMNVAGAEPMAAGHYVMLSVTDDGCGIPADILSKIYEPFFTTKEQGKGTGLGLSLVYGIVKQAGGHVWVESTVGEGTTFRICLPRVDEPATPRVSADARLPAKGTETILLVEDEESLRAIAREILEEHGYQILDAGSASAAIEIARHHPAHIHLLVTDVVMPGMNGRVLAESLLAVRSDLEVLFMSGYTNDVIANHGVLDTGTLFLEKPFSVAALLSRVRQALDRGKVA
jgi:CheY-like chemotaxis protein